MKKILIGIFLVVNVLFVHQSLHGEIVLEINRDINSMSNDRAIALFRQTLIEELGWEWFFENLIYPKELLIITLMESEGLPGIFITSKKTHDIHFYEQVNNLFDVMSERNDTISLFLGRTPYENLLSSNSSEFFKVTSRNSYVMACNLAIKSGKTYWSGPMLTHGLAAGTKEPNCFVQLFIFPTYFLDGLVVNEYKQACRENDLKSFYESDDVRTLNDREKEMFKKYLLIENKKILSKPLPKHSYRLDYTYNAKNRNKEDNYNILISK